MIILTYNGRSNFFFKEKIKINKFIDKHIIEATIKTEYENIEIEFKTSFANENQALISTSKIVEDYTKFFRFETGYEISDLICTESKRIVDSKINEVIAHSTLELKVSTFTLRELGNLDEYKYKLENFKSSDYNSFVNLYLNICNLEDVVGKYIMLYSILSSFHTKQALVDDYIKILIPNVELRKSTKISKKDLEPETIFTSLRNQIGHTSAQIDIKILEQEISENLEELKKITKEAIKSKY